MAYHNYISFYLIFIYLFLEIESFNPAGRLSHYSVLVGNKLYFFGGETSVLACSNEVFYLDISQPFNIASPPWNDLTANGAIPIKSCWGAASLGAQNEQAIYLFGGLTRENTAKGSPKPFVHKLNLKSGQWEIPIVKGKIPEDRLEMRAVNDNSGKIHIFGGHQSLTFLNDMITFNEIESSWSVSYQYNAPTLAGYSATLLSNGVIVYIGGWIISNGERNIDISQISLFDTKSSTWSMQKADMIGQIDDRDGHIAVLAPNGKIIIHGGSKVMDLINSQVTPDVAVLNIEKTPFEWTIPTVSSNIGKQVPSLVCHTADLVGNHMIIAFGNITQPNALPLAANANIYIMDIRNYTWVDAFELDTSSTNSSTPAASAGNQSDQLTTMKVAIGTISGFVGAVVLMIIVFFGYRRYQRYQKEKQDEIIRIPANE